MIRFWRYDDGSPIWSDKINDFIGEACRPAWRCMIYAREFDAECMQEWLESNLTEDQYETTVRFNSGDPAIFVNLYDTESAALFYLTWSKG